jgi:ubiquitin-conjugating enzyme E2 Z
MDKTLYNEAIAYAPPASTVAAAPVAAATVATFISKDAMKRIISDVKELRRNPLSDHGIYYEHDDTHILKGQALIIGPRDTPYENGYYLFKFEFPGDYPHTPPKVVFCTGDDNTRFNPNLYRSGKVCLSILNTWKGDQWSGCQTISSILLAICTLLTNEPLLNEPGVKKDHRDFNNYNKIIQFKNIQVAILGVLENKNVEKEFGIFLPIMREHFQKEKETIRAKVLELLTENEIISTRIYQMTVNINYKNLLDRLL